MQIKICGITRVEDALAAVDLGAAMLGLNFYERSPRFVTLPQAQQIAGAVKSRTKLVGVFVNMSMPEVLRVARAVPLDAVQLHGDELPEDCKLLAAEFTVIRALNLDTEFKRKLSGGLTCCKGLLLDTPSAGYGGSGKSFHWAGVDWTSVRASIPDAKLYLAGGLRADNVAEAIAVVHPDVVDVCSGVESAKGIKSVRKMSEFVAAVRAAERQNS